MNKLLSEIVQVVINSGYRMITNPCGEICLVVVGGYCLIGDVVPYHARPEDWHADLLQYLDWDDEAEDAFRTMVRALIRTNTMDCLFKKEVERTNRIGVSMTGIHEYAFARFGYGFRDLIDEQASLGFWLTLSRFKRAVVEEAASYSAELGLRRPTPTPPSSRLAPPASCSG